MVRVTPMAAQSNDPGTSDVGPVERVDVYYALNNDWPMTRFWRTSNAARGSEGAFTAPAPLLGPDDVIYAFANVTYRSTVRISSRLVKRCVAELAGARPTLARPTMIDAMDTATDWNWVPAYTDPKEASGSFFEPWQGAGGEPGFTLDATIFNHRAPMTFYFGTRKIGDPQFRAAAGWQTLWIDVLSESLPTSLTVRVKHRRPREYGQEFEATWKLATEETDTIAAGAWRRLRMERGRFHNAQGVELPDWEHVEHFILNGTSDADRPPVFKRLRWEQ